MKSFGHIDKIKKLTTAQKFNKFFLILLKSVYTNKYSCIV